MGNELLNRLWREHVELSDALDDPTDKQLQEVRVCDLLEESRAEIVALREQVAKHESDRTNYVSAWGFWISTNAHLCLEDWLAAYSVAVPHPPLDGPESVALIWSHVDRRMREAATEIVRLKSAIEERDRELLVAHRQIVHLGSNHA